MRLANLRTAGDVHRNTVVAQQHLLTGTKGYGMAGIVSAECVGGRVDTSLTRAVHRMKTAIRSLVEG
jgi:hypothetical protein